MASEKTIHEDQKQRTLAALERRFAAARAERDIRQNNLKPNNSKSSSSSLKKGNYTFVGHVASEDFNKTGSTYLKLSQSIDENLIINNSSDIGQKIKVDSVLHDLFRNGEGSQKYNQGSRSLKIDNWVMLDNYVQSHTFPIGSRLRALKTHSKRSKKHMSMKQHKKIGTLDLPKDFHKYELYRPVHEYWKNMMTQHLKRNGFDQLARHFMDLELHGAIVSVIECKVTSFIGVSGIMIRETAETFGIVTRNDKFRVVPKKLSVFVVQFDTWKVTLLGDKLGSRIATLGTGL